MKKNVKYNNDEQLFTALTWFDKQLKTSTYTELNNKHDDQIELYLSNKTNI